MSRARAPGWPEIEGIDTADARARWCGDAALFVKILAQMLERFGDLRGPTATGHVRPDEAGDAAHRMHKLRGAAASLGARSIFFIAGQLEAAYLGGDLELAAHLRGRLAEAMCRLQEAAGPLLSGEPRPAAAADRGDGVGSEGATGEGAGAAGGKLGTAGSGGGIAADTPGNLRRLDELLRRQDLAALALFERVSIDLEKLLGVTPYRRMLGHVENLRFEQAAQDLRAVIG